MKTECEKCGARYRIPEEKLEGKLLKIKCKKCEHIFTVRDMLAAPSRDTLSAISRKTGVISTLAGSEGPREWYYAVNGQSFGPYSDIELVERFENAQLGSDAHVWKQGLPSWLPAMQVPDFAAAIESAQTNLPGFSLPFAPKANPRRPTESSGRYTVEVRHPGAAMDSTRLAAEDELDIDFAFASAFGDHARGVSQTAPHRRNPIIERAESPVVDTLAEQIRQATAGKREGKLSAKESAIASLSAAARESRSPSQRDASAGDDSDDPYPGSGKTNPRAHVDSRRETIISSERRAIDLPPTRSLVREPANPLPAKAPASPAATATPSGPKASIAGDELASAKTQPRPALGSRGTSSVPAASAASRSASSSAPMTLSQRLEQLKSQSAASAPKRPASVTSANRTIGEPPARPSSPIPNRPSTKPSGTLARTTGAHASVGTGTPAQVAQTELTAEIAAPQAAQSMAEAPSSAIAAAITSRASLEGAVQTSASAPVHLRPQAASPEATSEEATSEEALKPAQPIEIPASKLPSGIELGASERFLLNDNEETFTGQSSDPKELFQHSLLEEKESARRLATQELNVDDFIEEISDILVMGESSSGRRFMKGSSTQAIEPREDEAKRTTQPNPLLEEIAAQKALGVSSTQLEDTVDIPSRSHTARVIAMARGKIRKKVSSLDRRRRKELLLIALVIAALSFASIFILIRMNERKAAEAYALEQAEIARIAQIEALQEAERIRAANFLAAKNRAASSVALAIGRAERVARAAGQERQASAPARVARTPRPAAQTARNQVAPASSTTSAPIPVSASLTSTSSTSSRNPSKAYFSETLQNSVRSSVGRCAQRARAISGSLNFSRLELSITIRPDGTVERVGAQRSLRDSPFMNCMSTESSRWRFASFQGSRTTIQHSFVVQ